MFKLIKDMRYFLSFDIYPSLFGGGGVIINYYYLVPQLVAQGWYLKKSSSLNFILSQNFDSSKSQKIF